MKDERLGRQLNEQAPRPKCAYCQRYTVPEHEIGIGETWECENCGAKWVSKQGRPAR